MMEIIAALVLILAAGSLIAVLLTIRYRNRQQNTVYNKNDLIVNEGIDVETGQMGSNQNKYFRGMSGEIPDTMFIGGQHGQSYASTNSVSQVIFCNVETGRTVTRELGNYLMIGRSCRQEEYFLQISENTMVSGVHCCIGREQGMVYLEDCDSRNHTYLNGRQVYQREYIKSGDIVALGPEQYRVTFY